MQVDLNGQIALVTGAARGIGVAIAEAFVKSGATVIFSDKDSVGARAAARASTAPERARGVTLNVADEAEVESVISEVLRGTGGMIADFQDVEERNVACNLLSSDIHEETFLEDAFHFDCCMLCCCC